ncbi:hypothetical protein ANO11243_094070 [Dothideomycetidae sp. 11243]|nr:hypothetical protein ANO11243_094070 [fungal sp. No.11243]
MQTYHPPLSLTIVSGVFLALGATCALILAADIILRRGWKSMMWIMIPVYIINAAYLGPLTIYVYWRYGRPKKVGSSTHGGPSCHNDNEAPKDSHHAHSVPDDIDNAHSHHHDHGSAPRPMLATILVGVFHCGAGCVLGDIVGEWLVYGVSPTIRGHTIWAELLIDYAFALLFGIVFQYFSIAPMIGEYGPRTVWRAAKADILSLTSFELGLFGWMVAYQVGIFGYRLDVDTWTYWWMMQVGMILGFVTAIPTNWFLIGKGIKEPCA